MATYSTSSILAPSGSSAAVQPYTATYTGSANVGDYVFLDFISSGTGTLNAPTDSAGNTYTIMAQASTPNFRTGMAWTRVTKPIVAGVTTVSVNSGGTSFKGSAAFVITPQSSDLMLEPDKAAISSSQTTINPVTGSSGTLATDFEIAIAFYGWTSADTFTETATWTNPQGAGAKISTTTTVVSAASQILFPTAKTALNPAPTIGASVSDAGGIVTFRLANVYAYKPPIGSTPFAGPLATRPMTRLRQYPQTEAPVVGGNVTVTPVTASLITTSFAPQVNLGVIPGTASLVLTSFAPVIDLMIVPATASLVLTTFAPTASVSNNISVTPGTASLVLTTFAPQVNLGVTPATAALVINSFAPAVNIGTNITPATASLTLTSFAPTLDLKLTPATASLSLTTFAPTVTSGGSLVVTPGTQALILTTYAPAGGASGGGGAARPPSIAFDNEGRPQLRVGANLYHPL